MLALFGGLFGTRMKWRGYLHIVWQPCAVELVSTSPPSTNVGSLNHTYACVPDILFIFWTWRVWHVACVPRDLSTLSSAPLVTSYYSDTNNKGSTSARKSAVHSCMQCTRTYVSYNTLYAPALEFSKRESRKSCSVV